MKKKYKKVFSLSLQSGYRNYTVRDLLETKGKKKLTQINVTTPEEAAAAEEAGIDLIIAGPPSPMKKIREAAPKTFFTCGLNWTEHESKESVVRKIKRDQNIVKKIKEMHDWKCQACSFTFMKEDGSYYVEAAHIKQLSKSHDDSLENLLALCANCHKMLDLGSKKVKNDILKKCGLKELQ